MDYYDSDDDFEMGFEPSFSDSEEFSDDGYDFDYGKRNQQEEPQVLLEFWIDG